MGTTYDVCGRCVHKNANDDEYPCEGCAPSMYEEAEA